MTDHEEIIIAYCMVENQLITKGVQAGLTSEHFNVPWCRVLWSGMVDRVNQGLLVEYPWAVAYLKEKTGKADEMRLAMMPSEVRAISEFDSAVEVLITEHQRRSVIDIARTALTAAPSAHPLTVARAAYDRLGALVETNTAEPDTDDDIKRRIMDSARGVIRVDIGYDKLNWRIKGIEPGTYIVAGGHTSHGKSMFAMNIIFNLIEQGYHCTLFSTETNKEGFTRRLATRYSGLNPSIHHLDEAELDMYSQAVDLAFEKPVEVYKVLSLSDIRMRIRRGKSVLYVVDYIQEVRSDIDFRENDVKSLAYISRELERLTKELDTTILVLSQFHRPGKHDDDYAPDGFSFRGSGGIEESADITLIMNYPYQLASAERREKIRENGNEFLLNIQIWKNRKHGLTDMLQYDFCKEDLSISERKEAQ